MFSILSRRCPLLATSLSVLFCLFSMLISDSRFDLVWFRLSCDHGWIRSGSVNVRKQQHRGSRWRLQAHRLHFNTPGTPTESTQRRSTPATKSADQSGLGPQHGVCHRGPWGTICPQPPCTADTATPVIRQKPAEDEIPPGARDSEIPRQHRRDSRPASQRGGGS